MYLQSKNGERYLIRKLFSPEFKKICEILRIFLIFRNNIGKYHLKQSDFTLHEILKSVK